MSTTTLRPTSTVSNTATVGGGGTAHANLADESDSTYLAFDTNGDSAKLGLTDITITAGSIVKSIATRLRLKASDTRLHQLATLLEVADDDLLASTVVNWKSIQTIQVLSSAEEYADADIDAATLTISLTQSATVSVYAAYVDVVTVPIPVVVVSAPTGTINDEDTPVVEWADTLDTDGGLQTFYEVKIFNAAQYGAGGFDPDETTPVAGSDVQAGGVREWTPDDLLPDATYRSYVRVAQTVIEAHWSDWDYEGFVLDGTRPAEPTISATPEDSNGRILLELAEGAGGDVTTDYLQVQRSDDGANFADLRAIEGDGMVLLDAGVAETYDREAANGLLSYYRVRAVHDFTNASTRSAWVTDSATWESDDVWFRHPTQPELDASFTVRSQPSQTREISRGVFKPLSRPDPIVIADVRMDPTGEIVLRLDSDAEREALDALLDTADSLLVQTPLTWKWDDRWCAFGDHQRVRVIDNAFNEVTFDTLPWHEVARPEEALAG